MKLLMSICCMMVFNWLAAQQLIEVGWDKTTYLVFDSNIESVDRGSRELLVQRDEKGLNLLRLKAGNRDLDPTNLHVLTSDGKLHGFQVVYAHSPKILTLDLRKNSTPNEKIQMKIPYSPQEFREIHSGLPIGEVMARTSGYAMKVLLQGLYFDRGLLFFDFRIANSSAIPYELSRVEARIKDRKAGKRSSSRSVPLTPVFGPGDTDFLITSAQEGSLLMVYESFTIAAKKELEFSFYERRGDRQLNLTISGKKLLKASSLPISNLNQNNNGSGEF